MRLVCVNNKKIKSKSVGHTCFGKGLVEGSIYTTSTKSFIDEDNDECYYIDGLGVKLKCRFAELLDKVESILVKEQNLCLN